MYGKLSVVGTPIGNLSDFSPRGLSALQNADFIAAEDTRVTLKLLNHFGIKAKTLSYHEHNKVTAGKEIIERLKAGENCALVTDAGMPAISDPGEDLVRLCHENGITVEAVPGPSALITALAVSGNRTGRFCFEGFLSVNRQSRRIHLEELKNEKRTMIFYEAPHKLVATLNDMKEAFGDREITLVRELTKIHEEIIKTTFSGALERYSETPPKGEFVLIIEGKTEEEKNFTLNDAVKTAAEFIKNGDKPSIAAKKAAQLTGIRKSDIYKEISANSQEVI